MAITPGIECFGTPRAFLFCDKTTRCPTGVKFGPSPQGGASCFPRQLAPAGENLSSFSAVSPIELLTQGLRPPTYIPLSLPRTPKTTCFPRQVVFFLRLARLCSFGFLAFFPTPQQPPHDHHLPEMIRIVIGNEQRLAQNGLTIAVWNLRMQIRLGIRD